MKNESFRSYSDDKQARATRTKVPSLDFVKARKRYTVHA